MDTLLEEVVILVLSYNCSDPEDNGVSPCRISALQLYRTCKRFAWLADAWIMGLVECEVDDYYGTCDIFGKVVGPTYCFHDGFSGYHYSNGVCIVGNHFYHVSPFPNPGGVEFLVVNGKVYQSPEGGMPEEVREKVLEQWKKGDIVSYDFCHGERCTDMLLVRRKVEDYPRYSFDIPRGLVLEGNRIQVEFAPEWVRK